MLNPNLTEIIKKLIMNLYLDNSTNSFDNLQVAIEFYKNSKACLKDANFKLRKWATNNCVIQKYIDQKQDHKKELNDSETYVESLHGTSISYRKVLSLNWKTDSYEFIFDLGVIYDAAKNLDFTKRNILRIAAMLFDPLGLTAPITLQPKLLYQEVCRKKFDWDELINDTNINDKWSQFLLELGTMRLLNAPRNVLRCGERRLEIHGFYDSSGKGYGACVFVRVVFEHGVNGKVVDKLV